MTILKDESNTPGFFAFSARCFAALFSSFFVSK